MENGEADADSSKLLREQMENGKVNMNSSELLRGYMKKMSMVQRWRKEQK